MKAYIILIAVITLLSSCRERLDVDLETTYPRLIVDARIKTDNAFQTVKLTQSASYFDNKPAMPVSNALVFVTVENTTIRFNESATKAGMYVSEIAFSGKVGSTYKLHIQNVQIDNGTTEYTAESTMPQPVYVKDVMVKPVYKDEFAPPGAKFAVKATFDDNPANQDNYVFRLYKNGKELTDSLFKVGITDDRMWNGSKIDTTEIFFIMFNYKLGRGTSVVVATDSVRTNDTIILETEGTTFGYRSFVENMQLQYAGSSPIGGGPPANVATNINPKDKAVGYFATYTVSRDTVIMK